MLQVYIFCLVLGGVFVLLSTLSGVSEIGGGDADFDLEADSEADYGLGPEGQVDGDIAVDSAGTEMSVESINFDFGSLDADVSDMDQEMRLETEGTDPEVHTQNRRFRPYLSLRFWTFLLAFFGLTGTLFTFFEVWTSTLGVAGISVGMGLSAGLFASYLMYRFGEGKYSKALGDRDFLGASGEVQLPVGAGDQGKVRLRLRGRLIDMFARPHSDETFERGDECFVVDVDEDQGIVEIISIEAAKHQISNEKRIEERS